MEKKAKRYISANDLKIPVIYKEAYDSLEKDADALSGRRLEVYNLLKRSKYGIPKHTNEVLETKANAISLANVLMEEAYNSLKKDSASLTGDRLTIYYELDKKFNHPQEKNWMDWWFNYRANQIFGNPTKLKQQQGTDSDEERDLLQEIRDEESAFKERINKTFRERFQENFSKSTETVDKAETEQTEEPVPEQTENKIAEELAAVKDQLLRTMAEYDNFRKRSAREKDALRAEIITNVTSKFLPILDNLERALSAECSDENYKKGVEMIDDSFLETLKGLGVEEIASDGAKFDPALHQAVHRVQSEDVESGTVVQTFAKGYKIGDKVIRFAMVAVAE